MLTFMILPTIVSLSLNTLDGVDSMLISAGMALGNTKTRAIYKICKKEARNGITVSIVIAFARAIGETMAVSMILQSQQYNNVFSGGFMNTITSDLRTLGSLISANMFAEGGGPALQSLLFAFGLFMFVFVMILNSLVLYVTNKNKKNKKGK
jgi:phosphate transport system permease protein